MRFLLLLLTLMSIVSADCSGYISQSVPAVVGNGGGLVNVTVSLTEGPGEAYVSVHPRIGFSTQESIRQAAEYAMASSGRECNVIVDFSAASSATSLIEGPSAGTALAVMTYALLEDKELRTDTVITGAIDPLGRVGTVGGLYEKAKGAAAKGAKYFITPVEGLYETLLLRNMQDSYGITILQAQTVEEVIGFMTENESIEQTEFAVEEREVPDIPDYDFPDPAFIGVAEAMIEAEEEMARSIEEGDNHSATIKSFFSNEVERQKGILEKGYLFSAANEAFLNYIDIATLKVIISGDPDLARKKGEASICLGNIERPVMTDQNFQWVIGADLRQSWANERLEEINTTEKLLIEERYVTYNALMYARAWCIVAESLLAAAPEGGIQLDEDSWRDIAEEKLAEAREATAEGGAMEKLESAERSFDNGRYGAAIYDSVYVIENSRTETIDDENLTKFVMEERVSLWGQVYQSHAAFLLEQNQSVAAYKTASYAFGLDEATVEMANAMIPIVEEEEEVSEEVDIIPLILVSVGSISFLLIVLLLFMKRGKHGNNSTRTGKAHGAEQEKSRTRIPENSAWRRL